MLAVTIHQLYSSFSLTFDNFSIFSLSFRRQENLRQCYTPHVRPFEACCCCAKSTQLHHQWLRINYGPHSDCSHVSGGGMAVSHIAGADMRDVKCVANSAVWSSYIAKLSEVLRFDLDLSLRFVSHNQSWEDNYAKIVVSLLNLMRSVKFCFRENTLSKSAEQRHNQMHWYWGAERIYCI